MRLSLGGRPICAARVGSGITARYNRVSYRSLNTKRPYHGVRPAPVSTPRSGDARHGGHDDRLDGEQGGKLIVSTSFWKPLC